MKKATSFTENNLVRGLRESLQYEFKNHVKNGIYSYTQKKLAYSSNRIEGSTLTADQTSLLFDTGTLYSDEVFRAKDIEEANGHFLMFNHMLKTLDEPLTEELIKKFHWELKSGVFEDKANGYPIGEYKSRANIAGSEITVAPKDVSYAMHELVSKYIEQLTFEDIVRFHSEFEHIHPFQDGNGRVGRMIILKQCLDHNIVPVIIRDIHKAEYNRYLNKAQHEQDYKGLEAYFEKEQKYYQESTIPMIFDFDELFDLLVKTKFQISSLYMKDHGMT